MSDRDVAGILREVLDAPQLRQYYHVDVLPERTPLRIARGPALTSDPGLEMFGVPVVYQSPEELQARGLPHLSFSRLQVEGSRADLTFSYDVEPDPYVGRFTQTVHSCVIRTSDA